MADEIDNDPTPQLDSVMSEAQAASAMASALSGRSAPDRSEDGRFASRAVEADLTAEADKVVDLKTGQPVKDAAKDEPAEDEDVYWELPPDKDGEAPRRIKAEEVWQAYEDLPKVREELENARKSAPVPMDYVQGLAETVRTRTDLLQGLQVITQMIRPSDPSIEMLNEMSDKYDPQGYFAAKQKADADRQIIAQLRERMRQEEAARKNERDILTKAAIAREQESLLKQWPEYSKLETRKQFRDDLVKAFGFSDGEVEGTADHRILLMARDALELRALKAKQAEAVKVVRQKPKLVKGAARTTTDPKAANRTAAMDRLASSGSMRDAAMALKGLI